MPIHHARGPKTSDATRKVAEEQLRAHPNVSTDAEVDIWEDGGHWVAAWHQAEFPPAKDDGGESEESPEESGPPKNEGGDEGGSPDGPPSDDGGEGPPKKDGPEKGGEKHELSQLLHLVTMMAQALGIEPGGPGGPGESPVPGEEMGPPPPGPPGAGGPPGHGGPPPHGGGPGGPGETIQHQRALKPGEAPPGTTPVGAPAFASTVPDSHPWGGHIGKVASFTVKHTIPENVTLASVDMELQRLAYNTRCPQLPGGFKVKQVTEGRDDDGHRIAKALISAY